MPPSASWNEPRWLGGTFCNHDSTGRRNNEAEKQVPTRFYRHALLEWNRRACPASQEQLAQSGSEEEEEPQASVLGEEKSPSANGHWNAAAWEGGKEGVGWDPGASLPTLALSSFSACQPHSVTHPVSLSVSHRRREKQLA